MNSRNCPRCGIESAHVPPATTSIEDFSVAIEPDQWDCPEHGLWRPDGRGGYMCQSDGMVQVNGTWVRT